MVKTMKSAVKVSQLVLRRETEKHTKDELLGGREHVQGERHLVLVVFQAQPSQKGSKDRRRGRGSH